MGQRGVDRTSQQRDNVPLGQNGGTERRGQKGWDRTSRIRQSVLGRKKQVIKKTLKDSCKRRLLRSSFIVHIKCNVIIF